MRSKRKTVEIPKILVPLRYIDELADEFNCTKQCVYLALSFQRNSALCEDIRRAAIDKYEGVETKVMKIL